MDTYFWEKYRNKESYPAFSRIVGETFLKLLHIYTVHSVFYAVQLIFVTTPCLR